MEDADTTLLSAEAADEESLEAIGETTNGAGDTDTDTAVFSAEPEADAAPPFVYALGRIEPRFPSLGLEKEFAQATGRTDTEGLTDRQALQAVLSQRENRYLARQLCWVFLIEGLETYILVPGESADIDLLLEAVRADPAADDVDVVIGTLGPIAPPNACSGLGVPDVVFD